MKLHTSRTIPRALILSSVAALTLLAGSARGQATATAARAYRVSAFGGVAIVKPDYGQDTDFGATIGADITRHFRLLEPSLEVRYTYSSGNNVNENTLMGGLKVEKAFGRLHPYADALFGIGNITFNHPTIFASGPYAKDNGPAFALGGGVDFDISRSFALKADAQYQSWKLGTEQSRLTPLALTVGVVYRIPFRGFSTQR